MRVGIIDSKICNIYSIINRIKKLEKDFLVIDSKEKFQNIDRLILPGVGAYPKAMENLKRYGLSEAILDFARSNRPILGICLGMQLLFEESEEFGCVKGLGLIPGRVVKIETELVLPHMGWNDLSITQPIPLLKKVGNGADVYFVHSYRVKTDNSHIAAITTYGEEIPAVVFCGNVMGVQFHPEKSLKWGGQILTNFLGL